MCSVCITVGQRLIRHELKSVFLINKSYVWLIIKEVMKLEKVVFCTKIGDLKVILKCIYMCRRSCFFFFFQYFVFYCISKFSVLAKTLGY